MYDEPALAGALLHALPSLTYLGSSDPQGTAPHIFAALPAAVTDLTFSPRRGYTFKCVLAPFAGGPGATWRGALVRIVVLGREESEIEKYWDEGVVNLARAPSAG